MNDQLEQASYRLSVRIFSAMLVLCLMLAACGPAPAATEPPAPAEPAATEVPPSEAPASAELPVTDCGTLLPPENCYPDFVESITYTSFAQLPTGDCEIRLLDAGVGQCSTVTYTDNNGQVFTISIEGADAAAVQAYLQDGAAYFTVQQVGGGVTPPTDLNFPSLVTILVETTTKMTGRSQDELIIIRDDLVTERGGDATSVTLADVIRAVAAIPDEIQKAANDVVVAEFTAAAQAAGMSQEEIDQMFGQLFEELTALMYEPGAAFLSDSTAIPQDDSGYSNILMSDPTALAITLDWASAPKEEQAKLWLIWFSIDPSIGANAYHYYKEKCNTQSASVRISATAGSMTDTFWRRYPYYYNVGSKTADIQKTPSPDGMTHSSSPDIRSYDTYVKGGSNGGTYYIYGGWVQGSGCQ